MNIGTIVTPNVKGQIVIPYKIRQDLGITAQTSLQLLQAGQSIILHPISDIIRKIDSDSTYLEVLKNTQGSWAGDDWPKTEKRRHQIEQRAALKRKQTTW